MENPVKMDDLGGKHPLFSESFPYFASHFFLGGNKKPIKPDAQKASKVPAMGHGLPGRQA